jgi:hypothetical protein
LASGFGPGHPILRRFVTNRESQPTETTQLSFRSGSKEALAIAALHQDFEGFPEPTRGELQEKLRSYAREAIDAVHPPLDVPQDPHSSSPALKALFAQVMGFQAKLKSEEIVQAETFTRLNTLVEHRRYLIASGEGGLPNELWQVMCLGGILLIGLMSIFDMEFHVHLILSGAMALFLGSVVFLIVAMDNPFKGGMTVDSAPIESVLASMGH